jgi:hypothetical protein
MIHHWGGGGFKLLFFPSLTRRAVRDQNQKCTDSVRMRTVFFFGSCSSKLICTCAAETCVEVVNARTVICSNVDR